MILSLGIKYSMCELISDLSYCSWATFVRYGSYNAKSLY